MENTHAQTAASAKPVSNAELKTKLNFEPLGSVRDSFAVLLDQDAEMNAFSRYQG